MFFRYFNLQSEEGILRASIAGTIALAVIGIIFGLLARSSAIIFDSFYEMVDAVMTLLALLVVRLIAAETSGDLVKSKLSERFTMGFWHLEPIVLLLNGTLLIGAAGYAFITAIDSFISGGREVLFGYSLFFTFISVTIEFTLGMKIRKSNKKLNSQLLALDSRAWLMSASISVAYLIAFGFGYFAQETDLAWLTPYIDPVVLGLVCLFVIPIPLKTVKYAISDILLVTPQELKLHVDEVAADVVERYGFQAFRAYVARVGRGRQIELYFIVPKSWPEKKLEYWDNMRDEISREIGGENVDMWLTIVFTTDLEWAE